MEFFDHDIIYKDGRGNMSDFAKKRESSLHENTLKFPFYPTVPSASFPLPFLWAWVKGSRRRLVQHGSCKWSVDTLVNKIAHLFSGPQLTFNFECLFYHGFPNFGSPLGLHFTPHSGNHFNPKETVIWMFESFFRH